ncbi:MAG: hypothetical protein E7362_03540 [Clostridiales bacterium]|nr:hypothetical protein [Clostridiales bacterium]
MITMKRSTIEDSSVDTSRSGGVQLLERPVASEVSATETTEEARIRMQRNLNRLLNYDRVVEEVEEVVETPAPAPVQATMEEDIRPTSTTLQFGDGNGEKLLKDLNVSHEVSDTKSYRLSSKGRLMVVLYSLIVAVVLAFVIVNTGILASLDTSASDKSATLNDAMNDYNVVQEKVDSISDNNYVIDVAQNELGMVPRA